MSTNDKTQVEVALPRGRKSKNQEANHVIFFSSLVLVFSFSIEVIVVVFESRLDPETSDTRNTNLKTLEKKQFSSPAKASFLSPKRQIPHPNGPLGPQGYQPEDSGEEAILLPSKGFISEPQKADPASKWTTWATLGLSVLVVACACALPRNVYGLRQPNQHPGLEFSHELGRKGPK
ncbi:hypothetical protein K503DRAFT_855901 [Rhizopogon vinicolor AM-OR11-026]|uniref:Transmembrane protein n=1 Tax=Rhizopogon vinicolor AM-OR11-026 TaxID=1314800 RepID=A0A1B7N466_9AGAM|nr:hypothetical protein K503DRAFT_855901 [Rhizopogon vinicolor AM-OR11-026]